MTYPLSTAALDSIAASLPPDAPIHMLNLLRFHPDGGRERWFTSYIGAFRAISADMGIEGIGPVWNGAGRGTVAGPEGEAWDAIVLVHYPSIGAFRAIVESERYRTEAAPHREASVVDWRLIAQVEVPRP